ncbi:MAG TPA: DUF6526 family protein [Chitinophagaceae bacterium]|jgi:hypothetical protein|nr:DUF6526 family protein [Chitinophagaceae bacterium]
MPHQNYSNHRRFLPLWHIILPLIVLIILTMNIINLVHSGMTKEALHQWIPLLLIPVFMIVHWIYTRKFALVAQDRAIRAEEALRHFILTGKPIDPKLRLGQVIALRFASDEELPALAKRAVEEGLTSKQIKEAIKNWRADTHRV